MIYESFFFVILSNCWKLKRINLYYTFKGFFLFKLDNVFIKIYVYIV
jgi:hypothetical protein